MLEINVKISSLKTLFHNQLAPLYEEKEIEVIFFIYLEEKCNVKKYQYSLNPAYEVAFDLLDLEMLANGCPIQYVTGKTTFYNVKLSVNQTVLIPRQETEELVSMILEKEKSRRAEKQKSRRAEKQKSRSGVNSYGLTDLRSYGLTKILEIGTGSGAIAIALAKNIENATVWATDISEDALETARQNAIANHVDIHFLHHDILKDEVVLLPDDVDIIVSNPPYIPNNERATLHKNVTDYEPHSALFVPDNQPLLFYSAIAGIAKKILRSGGVLYFETYEKFHLELSVLLAENDFKEIELWNDISGKPRFVRCKKL